MIHKYLELFLYIIAKGICMIAIEMSEDKLYNNFSKWFYIAVAVSVKRTHQFSMKEFAL